MSGEDESAGLTAAQRATAYEAEAAHYVDRVLRHLPEGISTDGASRFVELIVQAAVLRVNALTAMARACETRADNP